MAATKSQGLSLSSLQYIKTGIIFSLCYWAMEAVQDVITFERGPLIDRLLFPDAKTLWMSVLVICVILLFGVDRIVKKHQGQIEAEIIPGKNTVFSVFLPIIATRVEKQESSRKDCFSQGFGKRILLVEDEENVREFTRRALNKNGYTVVTANCAEEAEQIFRHDREGFDLLFTDVVLPDKNGVDLVLDLKAFCPELNVLLCSGHNDSKSQCATIEKYGFPFLKKPFELNELLRGIQQVI